MVGVDLGETAPVTTGLTYSQYVTQIAELMVVEETDTNFLAVLPMIITYAENRMYKDLDLLITSAAISSYSLTAGNRSLTIDLDQGPLGIFTVSEQINVITPAGVSDPELGKRNPCLPTTKEFLDAVYGDSSFRGLPKYFVPFNDDLFYVGPFPDANYHVELVGTLRPNSLSAANTSTFLSLYMPETFVCASMIYASGYQHDFGRQSDDPAQSQSWENQYQLLMKTTSVEEARKKFEAAAWSSQSPAIAASPTRG